MDMIFVNKSWMNVYMELTGTVNNEGWSKYAI